MSNVIEMKKSKSGLWSKAGVALAAAGTSLQAFAVDHSAAITAAQTDGTSNVTAAVTAVIAIAAVVLGVGIVMRLLSR